MKIHILLFSLLLLIFSSCNGETMGDDRNGGADRYESPEQESARADTPAAGVDFTYAAKRATPGVVHIISTTRVVQSERPQMPNIPDLFRDFFGDEFWYQQPNPGPRQGSGSGVIISSDGYVVSNNHVIEGADEVEVILNDNRSYIAELIGVDPSTDIALLKINETGLEFIEFANSDAVQIGEWVLAVGNPFNLASTVTAGIVSAKTRNINILQDQAAIESFIQTDAAVNPGNSGGALVNLRGELIGINTAIATPTGTYAGYAFAVPSNIVRKVVDDLRTYGVVQRGYLGVYISNVNSQIAERYGLGRTQGVFVDSIIRNSAAADAGIQNGDVIVEIDNITVNSAPKLQELVGRKRPGDKVEVTLFRNGKEREIDVTLKNRSGSTEIVKREEKGALEVLGLELEALSRSELSELKIDGGVRVNRLSDGKIRRQTDMREGFIITHIEKKGVKTPDDVEKALKGRNGGVMIEGLYPDYPGRYYYAFGM